MLAWELGKLALEGLINRSGLHPSHIELVILGNVIQEVNTSNVAREAALAAGLPDDIPAFTTTMACISSSMAVTTAMDRIRTGQNRVVVAGGVETMSDVPIRFKRAFRKKLIEASKYRSFKDFLSFFKGLRPSDLLPDTPEIAEFSTGETMGGSCDKMCALYGIGRQEQDRYALRSHQLAAEATEKGWLESELFPVPGPDGEFIRHDNAVRPDTTLEKLEKLKPAFHKSYGTVTAGNASPLTDGASALLLMSREHAGELDMLPRALLQDYHYVARKPDEELLIGPAIAIPQLFDRNGISLGDIDVFEFHEAFAGQMLTVLHALQSGSFAKEKLNRSRAVGEIPMDKLNRWGGSLSLGHPFGATGARLVMTAANRLEREDGKLALVAACAAGGQGHALLIERI